MRGKSNEGRIDVFGSCSSRKRKLSRRSDSVGWPPANRSTSCLVTRTRWCVVTLPLMVTTHSSPAECFTSIMMDKVNAEPENSSRTRGKVRSFQTVIADSARNCACPLPSRIYSFFWQWGLPSRPSGNRQSADNSYQLNKSMTVASYEDPSYIRHPR